MSTSGFVRAGSTNSRLSKGKKPDEYETEALKEHRSAVCQVRAFIDEGEAAKRLELLSEHPTSTGAIWNIAYNDPQVRKTLRKLKFESAVSLDVETLAASGSSNFSNAMRARLSVSSWKTRYIVEARKNPEFVLCIMLFFLSFIFLALVFAYGFLGDLSSQSDPTISEGTQ